MNISAANIAAFRDYFSGRKEALVAFTRALVEAESPSGDEAEARQLFPCWRAAEAISVRNEN